MVSGLISTWSALVLLVTASTENDSSNVVCAFPLRKGYNGTLEIVNSSNSTNEFSARPYSTWKVRVIKKIT